MQADTRKKLTSAVAIAIVHYAVKDIFAGLTILQKMYFPAQLLNFLKYNAYEYDIMVGRCTPLLIKCDVILVLIATFISFAVYYAMAWLINYIVDR